MDSSAIAALVAGVAAVASAWFAATRSQRKQPEDRDAVITATAERVVAILRAELEDCLQRRAQERKEVAGLMQRVATLERQIRVLGAVPENGIA